MGFFLETHNGECGGFRGYLNDISSNISSVTRIPCYTSAHPETVSTQAEPRTQNPGGGNQKESTLS